MPWIEHCSAFVRWLHWKWKENIRDWNLRLCSFMLEYNFFPLCVEEKKNIGVVPCLLGLNVGMKVNCTCGCASNKSALILTYCLFVGCNTKHFKEKISIGKSHSGFFSNQITFFFSLIRIYWNASLHCIQNRWRRHLMKVSCFCFCFIIKSNRFATSFSCTLSLQLGEIIKNETVFVKHNFCSERVKQPQQQQRNKKSGISFNYH